jgi:hypothetical protein
LVYTVSGAAGVSEVRGHRNEIEIRLKTLSHALLSLLLIVCGLAETIQGVHDALVLKTSLNNFEMLILSKGQAVNLVTEVKGVTFHHQGHKYVGVSMAGDVEVSRNTVDLKVSLE